MHLSSLTISNYKCFNATPFSISLNPGLTVLVGENGSGKSAVIDAIRLVLNEDEYGNRGVSGSDFHRPVSSTAKERGADSLSVVFSFMNLTEDEQIAYLPWLDQGDTTKALLTMMVENKEDPRGRLKRKLWGGNSSAAAFEWNLLCAIACIYLPPLRDAEDKLRAFRGSRLARLLRSLRSRTNKAEVHPLEKVFERFNQTMLHDETIKTANDAIRKYARESMGSLFGQDTQVQFAEASFERIVERLRLLYYPILPGTDRSNPAELFRELDQNSLGFNNILYIATVLAELEGLEKATVKHKLLLVEEPEAHLHPQLQMRLLTYLEKVSARDNIQVIVTTHSPTMAASVSLNAMVVLSRPKFSENPIYTPLTQCGLSVSNSFFLERWLDITKSTLLFAKGVVLVEGIAEALLLPELSRTVLLAYNEAHLQDKKPESLEENGVSIVNMGGIFFDHFMQIFKGYVIDKDHQKVICDAIPVRCVGITDCDPDESDRQTPEQPSESKNPQIYLIEELIQHSANCRLFSNLKTFEYDLALEGNNISLMNSVYAGLLETDGPNKKKALKYAAIDWNATTSAQKAEAAFWLLNHIGQSPVGKGLFAQVLAERLSVENAGISLAVPEYIRAAILWSIGV